MVKEADLVRADRVIRFYWLKKLLIFDRDRRLDGRKGAEVGSPTHCKTPPVTQRFLGKIVKMRIEGERRGAGSWSREVKR